MQGSKTSIKICALFGSPRPGGLSAGLHDSLLRTFPGAEISRFHISSMAIGPCSGCLSCAETPVCPIDDDMHLIYDALRNADLVTFSFPLYFSSMPAQLKAVIDRCELLWNENKRGELLPVNKSGIACITAGGSYKDMFLPSLTVLSHLMNSLGGTLDRGRSVLSDSLDSCEGNERYKEIISSLKND